MIGFVSLHIPSALCLRLDGDVKILYYSLAILSAMGGLIGGISQLFLWVRHLNRHDVRRKPSSNPHVVFSLALSNFISCFGTMVLVFFLLFTYDTKITDSIYHHSPTWHLYYVIPAQLLLNFGYVLSWLWTLLYIVDVCLQVYGFTWSSVQLYHFICWPLASMFALACELIRYHSVHKSYCSDVGRLLSIAILWICVWSLIAIALVAGLIILERKIKHDVYCVSNAFTSMERILYKKIRVKFIVFVVAFLICWLPSLFDNLIFAVDRKDDFKAELWMVEVILNPLQGVFNYFIFMPQTRLHDLVPQLPGRKIDTNQTSHDALCHSIDSSYQPFNSQEHSCSERTVLDSCYLDHGMSRTIDSSFFHFTPHANQLQSPSCNHHENNSETQTIPRRDTDSPTESMESATPTDSSAYLVRLLGDEYPSL